MIKLKIKVTLKNNDIEKIKIYDALKTKNKIIYYDGCKVILEKEKITRENNEYKMEILFNESKIKYLLKKENKVLNININILNIKHLKVLYEVLDNKVYYEVEELK